MPWTDPFVVQVGNRALRQIAGTWPASGLFLALYKTSPTLAGSGGTVFTTADFTEYARQEVTVGAASGRVFTNSGAVTFATAATMGAPATATHAALFTAVTGGVMWMYGALTSPLLIGAGTPVVFPAGQIVFDELGTA